jgi:poly(A) polymerase
MSSSVKQPAVRPCPAPRGDERFEAVSLVIDRLSEAGFPTYLVGGCVRDMAIGREPKDFDVATAATPDEIESLFMTKTVAVGKAFGVMQVSSKEIFFEVATFRKDMDYQDGRRPEGVTFCGAEEDVLRRDFTVNGLLYDLSSEVIVDMVGGLDDLDRRTIRAIGTAQERFAEDHLRVLRAIRFSVQLDFVIEEQTWAALIASAGSLVRISRERIRDEFMKMIASSQPSRAVAMLVDSGCFPFVVPVEPRLEGYPDRDTLIPRIQALASMDLEDRSIALLAMVLHDLLAGCDRPDWEGLQLADGGRKALARNFGLLDSCIGRLRLSRQEEHKVLGSVVVAAFVLDQASGAHAPHVWIRLARWPGSRDGFVMARVLSDESSVHEICAEYGHLEENQRDPQPLITGRDLNDEGMVAGPLFKDILRAVVNAQLDGRIQDRQDALRMAKEIFSQA